MLIPLYALALIWSRCRADGFHLLVFSASTPESACLKIAQGCFECIDHGSAVSRWCALGALRGGFVIVFRLSYEVGIVTRV
jgi:hypothetical protein